MNSFDYYRKFIHISLFYNYDTTNNPMSKYLITNIIFNDKTHFVSVFKEWLIYGDNNEFCKRYYDLDESTEKIKLFCQFYEMNSVIFPNYCILPESKFLFRNIKQKQKVIDEIEGKATNSMSSINIINNQVHGNQSDQNENNNCNSHSQIFNDNIMKSLINVNISNHSSHSSISINKLIKTIGMSDSIRGSTSHTNHNEIINEHHNINNNNNNNKQETSNNKEIIIASKSKLDGVTKLNTELAGILKYNKKFIQYIGSSNMKIKVINTARKITKNSLTIKPLSQRTLDKNINSIQTNKNKFVNKLNIKEIKKIPKETKTISPKRKRNIHNNTNLLSDRHILNISKKTTIHNSNLTYNKQQHTNTSKLKISISPTPKQKFPKSKSPSSNIQTSNSYQKDLQKYNKVQHSNILIKNKEQHLNHPSKIKNKNSITNPILTINKPNQTQIKNYMSKPKYNIYYNTKVVKKINNYSNINFSLGNNSTSINRPKSQGRTSSPIQINNLTNFNNYTNNITSHLKNSFLKQTSNSNNNNIKSMFSKYNNRTRNHTKINLRLSKTTHYSKFKAIHFGKIDLNKQHPKTFRGNYTSLESNLNNFSQQTTQIKGEKSSFVQGVHSFNKINEEHNRNVKSDINQQKINKFMTNSNNSDIAKVNVTKSCQIAYSISNKRKPKRIKKKISPHNKEFISRLIKMNFPQTSNSKNKK